MALITRAQAQAADDVQRELVAVPEWGGDIWVRGVSGKVRDEYEASFVQRKGRKTKVDMQNARARLVVLSCVDEQGALVFDDSDVKWLGDKGALPLERIYSVAARLSGITDLDLGELVKKSEETPGSASNTG
ncbi:MAG TPA: hypothetical protein VGG64_29880 [Pirellulales bacterium]|jgi:hypothetical protein